MIVAAFDHLGGFALYVQDGTLKHHYSMLGVLEYTQERRAGSRSARSPWRWSSRQTSRSPRRAAR